MGKSQRDKGARGELEFASVCREHGYDTYRSAQHCGNTGDAADVEGLPGIHVEVKRTEKLSLYDALNQAKRDSEKQGRIPIVAHRKNYSPWVVIMDAEDWFALYREWECNLKGE